MIGSAEMAAEAVRIEDIRRKVAIGLFGSDIGLETREITPIPGSDEDSYGYSVSTEMTVQFEDWIHLGRGGSRSVWLGPDGVAYKVPIAAYYGIPANRKEFETYKENESLSEPNRRGRIPICCMYGDVLATEYVQGVPAYKYNDNEEIEEIEQALGLMDLHAWNVIQEPSGRMTIVDFAA